MSTNYFNIKQNADDNKFIIILELLKYYIM